MQLRSGEEYKTNTGNATAAGDPMDEDPSFVDDLDDEDYGDERDDLRFFIENDDQGRVRI
jgi:hypothetical protein